LDRGEDVLLDIDTQGAAQVRKKEKQAVLIFLLPPGPGELERRHRRRGTDTAVMARRLLLARREVTRCGEYDYLVVNEEVKEATENLRAIIRAERSRIGRQRRRAVAIQRAFRERAMATRTERRPS
jgi:guanylate kinase